MAKSKPTSTTSEEIINYEIALKELEQLVEQMEQGGLSLEESLKKFERGVSLIRNCQTALKTAEQKVQILMEQEGSSALQSFISDENS